MPCNMNLPSTPEELESRDIASWKELLQDSARWHSIPLLNHTPLHKLKDQSLVRFRGMVQDMMDPEIYLERYEIKSADGSTRLQQGKYRDCLRLAKDEQLDYNAESNVHGERRTLFVISLPGQNDWAKDHEKLCGSHLDNQQTPAGSGIKRALEQEDMEVDKAEETTSSSSLKRQCKEVESSGITTAKSTAVLGSDYLLNSPLPDRPSMACMIKVYEDFDKYTLNSLMDFVGFLSVDPALDASTLDVEAMKDVESLSELQAQNPSPFLIPRLHAFGVKSLCHANPLLDLSLLQPTEVPAQPSLETVHKDLRMLLKLCLFEDELAAEYLLSHLISTVYSRSEMQSIGKFALNICNLPKDCLQEYTRRLYEVLELLLPASHYLPMTLDFMNTAAFAPKKDYETNKLVSGLLQLAPHTHLMLDETHMQQGKLEANGVHAIQHLAHLINNQQLKCDFQYYQIDYNVDIPVLVISEGRSMLPSDFVLPINADVKAVEIYEESLKAALHYLQPQRLQQFRSYLTLARTSPFSVSEDLTEMIQQDFVDMRKANVKSNANDLHGLLVLSRLLGIARGKQALDKETWHLATEYESKRRQRLQSLPKSSVQLRN
ncbi:mini-chromosome maintenance complex-binding protein [Drosophila innubila]|uniref:mini-chromosome maintenance complex-binding protein n=1 Tax=Drosophila innubila TaxID=198719 RepID=UPI00148D0B41|nr:mini-chromosome maintenance complex-binding protein [Drosophila innubila]